MKDEDGSKKVRGGGGEMEEDRRRKIRRRGRGVGKRQGGTGEE